MYYTSNAWAETVEESQVESPSANFYVESSQC